MQMTRLIENMTATEIRIAEGRWDLCKMHHISCWPVRCHSVLAGWINDTGWHFNFIFSYGTSSIKDGVCCLMDFHFKGCNLYWATFVFLFSLTLDYMLVTSLRWYLKQAIEIIIALLTACNSCSLFYVTSILQNILCYQQHTLFLGVFSKLWKASISFVMSVCPSVCPHVITRLPLDRFSWNLVFEDSSKIFQQNAGLYKIWQE
jgi:hypothetical protein